MNERTGQLFLFEWTGRTCVRVGVSCDGTDLLYVRTEILYFMLMTSWSYLLFVVNKAVYVKWSKALNIVIYKPTVTMPSKWQR